MSIDKNVTIGNEIAIPLNKVQIRANVMDPLVLFFEIPNREHTELVKKLQKIDTGIQLRYVKKNNTTVGQLSGISIFGLLVVGHVD